MKKKKEDDKRRRDNVAPRHKKAGFVDVPVAVIDFPEYAMRGGHDEEKIRELAESIKRYGLINPITVRKSGSRFEVVAGARRFHAVKSLGLKVIECRIAYGDSLENELVKIHENIMREDVNVVDESAFLAAIMKKQNIDQARLSKMIGKSEAYVSERLKIGKWDDVLRNAVSSGELSFSSARELSRIKDAAVRAEMTLHGVKNGASPATAKQWADDANLYTPSDEGAGVPEGARVSDAADMVPRFPCVICGGVHSVVDLVMMRLCKPCKSALTEDTDIPKSDPAGS
jgi:ParB/RepB/Spo0J family partition protein